MSALGLRRWRSTWIAPTAQHLASRKAQPSTAISDAPATTHCSCSISPVTWSGRCSGRGNVHSSKGWREILGPMIARYRGRKPARSFRADAAFERPEVYEFLEAEGFGYDRRHDANGLNASGACGRASQNRGLGSGLPARRRRGPAGFFSKRSPRSIKATLAVSHTWGLGNFLIGLNITEKLITYWAFSSWLFCLAR